jgi:putative endonuclease
MAELRQQVGRAGEEVALEYLHHQGYRILERNFRCRFGEIDLVARDGRTLAFIEVKTRRSQAFGAAALAVTAEKQRRLIKASQVYLSRKAGARELCRFDVVTIQIRAGKPQVELIKDAFQLPADL